MVTDNPLACKSLASDAEMIPLPSEEVTPPVTKIYLTMSVELVTGCKDKQINRWNVKESINLILHTRKGATGIILLLYTTIL